jgi:1,4-alpha-glucan branching enzyme
MARIKSHSADQSDALAIVSGDHADPRKSRHRDWDTLVYNYGRNEDTNFLLSNALYWLRKFHIDSLRVDNVASMLYLDCSRKSGDWLPNKFGGRENLEAVEFLKRLKELAYVHAPGIVTVAEESTAWPIVSRPTYLGGLGFGYKWNIGWMHDTLEYMREDPIHRSYHHDRLIFVLHYASSENFVLPLSHDEVVHGKGSLFDKLPGDRWLKFANLRVYLTFMYGHPGKKLLLMGSEFAQEWEWNHDRSLDWHLLSDPLRAVMQRLVRDLNGCYRALPALYARDTEREGFEWIDGSDNANSVVSFIRRGESDNDVAVCVCNFTPVLRRGYRIGVPLDGSYREILNSDAVCYGGSNRDNGRTITAEAMPWHGRPYTLSLMLPPLGGLLLRPESGT